MPLSTDAPPRRLGPEARALAERFWPYCARYAQSFGSRYPHKRLDWEGAAALALCEAALWFDPSRGDEATRDKHFQFYLDRHLKGSLVELLRWSDLKGYRVKCARNRGGGAPSVFSCDLQAAPTWMFTKDDDHQDNSFAATFRAEEEPTGWDVDSADTVESLARKLPPKYAAVVRHLYLHADTATQIEAGRVLGLSESRVGQILKGALEMLREGASCKNL